MRRTTATAHLLVITSLVALGAAAVYGLLLYHVLNMRAEIVELARTIDVQAREEERLRSVKNVLEETAEERATLSQYFVHGNTVVSFIETIEGLGRSAGATITIVSVDTEESEQGVANQQLAVELVARGSWLGVMHFATLVDSLPFIVNASSVNFERGDIEVGDWRGTFAFTVAMIE